MKKKLGDFDLFECTQTELGLMMRVMNGWVVDGVLITDTITYAHREVEVYDPYNGKQQIQRLDDTE